MSKTDDNTTTVGTAVAVLQEQMKNLGKSFDEQRSEVRSWRDEIKSDMLATKQDLTALGGRVTSLETNTAAQDAVDKYKKWIIGAFVTVGAGVVANALAIWKFMGAVSQLPR
jgi:hypothetical protein